MRINRRTWLGGAAGLAGAAIMPAAAQAAATVIAPDATPAFRAAAAALADYAAADLADHGFPGMTIALRAADGQTARIALGLAELDARRPVTPDHVFQIGSISKSHVALALFALAAQGKLDLDAAAVSVVPELWLADRSITVAQILNHSAGLPDDSPVFPDVPGGKLWSATPPGQHFSYSNAGYDMLAFVVERASGMRFDRALQALVLTPLGMATALPVIRTADRARYARGYVPYPGDAAWFPRAPLAEGPWLDIDRAAGSVAMTSADMLKYMAFLGRVAQGDGAPLFPAALATRFATPVIDTTEFGKGARYGNGLATVNVDDGPCLHHTGGMLVFTSAVYVDRASGAGCFASVNIGSSPNYRPRQVAQHGVRLLRAVATGSALPPPKPIVTIAPVDDAVDFSGRFVGPRGEVLTFVAGGTALTLTEGGRQGRVKAIGPGVFASDLTGRDRYALDFVAATGRRDRLWYGDTLFARDAAVSPPAVPPGLAALAGTYASNDPWVGLVDIVPRGDAVALDGAGRLTQAADGSWRLADSPERLWFDRPIGGRPQRLNFSGASLWRTVV